MIAKPGTMVCPRTAGVKSVCPRASSDAATDGTTKKVAIVPLGPLPQPQIVTGSAKESHTSWPCAYSIYHS